MPPDFEALQGYPVTVTHPLAWGEMDAFGHVNNTVYFRYFENARIAYFSALDYFSLMEQTGAGPILASTSCRFRLPLTYPDTITVGARVESVAADRFLMKYLLVSHLAGKIAAEGEGLIVSFDYRQGAKCPLPEPIRAGIARLEGGRSTSAIA